MGGGGGSPGGGGGFGNPPGGGGFGNPPGGGGFGNPPGGGGFGPPSQPGGGGFGPLSGGGVQSTFGGGGGAAPPPKPKKKTSPLMIALVLAPVALCCFGGIGLLVYGGIESSQYNDLKPACDGVPIASAPAYQPGGAAQAIGFDRGSSGGWSLDYGAVPRTRRADEAGDVSAVVCVEDQTEERLERCAYTVGGGANAIDRFRYQRTVRLVAASTGQVIASTVVYGTEPAPCEEWESFTGAGTTIERRGEEVTDEDIASWVVSSL